MAKKQASKDLHRPKDRIGEATAAEILTTISRYGALRFPTTVAKNNCLRALALLATDHDHDDE
jgi:hypothetical protein